MKKLTLTFALAAMTAIGGNSVYAQNGSVTPFDFTKATDYHLIYLDGETVETNIPAAKIKKDFRTDDVTHFLYIWENTYSSNTAVGPNSNGVPGEYLDFSVTSVGWSGFGFAGVAPGKDMSAVDNSYYLHFAMKANDVAAHASHQVIINKDPNVGKIVIGNKPFVDNGTSLDPYGDFTRDGEWYNFDIPMSHLASLGCSFANETATTDNVFSMLSGGVAGTNICLDAIFFYRPDNGSSIDSEKLNDVDLIVVADGMITVDGNMQIQLFDISGKLVNTAMESMDVDNLNAGIYVVKAGNAVKKIAIK